MRVLLVDDEPAFAETLAQRLGLRGITAEVAPDGEAALAMLEKGGWDLIFLDVCLPGMNGVDLLKILHARRPELDVVMLSGAADMSKAVQAMRRGAVNWLSKPVCVDDVLAECRKAQERTGERRRAARLAEAARWRSLGRVAEGVAHEVNNPLNIMVQAAGLIRDCLDGLDTLNVPDVRVQADIAEARAAVETIRAQSLRVREITRKLLMVGHGLDPRLQALDVRAVLTRVLDLARGRLEATGVCCELDLPPEVENGPRPLGSALELQQICLHLVENALDAMPGGGSLRVTARLRPRAREPENALRPAGLEPGWYELTFADSGPGIAPDALPHIFEPFFSTRAGQAGQYAGLGLAVAHSLAHGRGCELTAANQRDGGAVFRLRLPLDLASAADVPDASYAPGTAERSGPAPSA